MKTSAATRPIPPEAASEPLAGPEIPHRGFTPQSVGFPPSGSQERRSLRMYTEEEVSEMLHVSLSQLRKWRMKQNRGRAPRPPFKKIGRLVRYPEQALLEYINGR